MTIKEAIEKATTRGDVAIVLLAGTFGFIIDSGLDILNFMSSGETGGAFGMGTLGIKMAWEELTSKSRGKKNIYKKADTITKLIEESDSSDKSNIIEKINTDKRLYELEVITLEEFDKTLINVINNVLRKQTKSE